MLISTDFRNETILIDPFSVDLVQYVNTTAYSDIYGIEVEKMPSKLVLVTVQGSSVYMDVKVFEADLLPALLERKNEQIND